MSVMANAIRIGEFDHPRSHPAMCVSVVGFVQKNALPAYYSLADVLVFPTQSDPWGLVVNEAMACGSPVIATDVAGCAADLLKDGWNGVVVPAERPSQAC